MSALGRKPTHAMQQRMSALGSIATAKADIRKSSCLLCPRKRTCAVQTPMSAKADTEHLKARYVFLATSSAMHRCGGKCDRAGIFSDTETRPKGCAHKCNCVSVPHIVSTLKKFRGLRY